MAAENAIEETRKRRRRKSSTEEVEAVDDVEVEGEAGGKGRATPGKRTREEEEESGGGNMITSPLLRFRNYLLDVRAELDKVVWPTREEAWRLARIVIITLLLSSLIMGLISFVMSQFVAFGLNYPVVFVVTFLIVIGGVIYYFRRESAGTRSY
jgi:preprotein translocase SecE subunit